MVLSDYVSSELAERLERLGFAMDDPANGPPYCVIDFGGPFIGITAQDRLSPPTELDWRVTAYRDRDGFKVAGEWTAGGRVSMGEAVEAARDLVDPYLCELATYHD